MKPQTLLARPVPPAFPAGNAAMLRALVPGLAADAARAIVEEVPAYGPPGASCPPGTLERLTLRFVGRFVERLIDPGPPLDDLIELCHRVGAAEARAGRTTDSWNTAVRAAAGAALRRIEHASGVPGGGVAALSGVATAQAFLDFVDVVTTAVSEGHARESAHGEDAGPVEALVRLLLADPRPEEHRVRDAMREARWSEPAEVAAVALTPQDRRPLLPPDILGTFATSRPFLIVPDPDGPGRKRTLTAALGGRIGAVGPTVPLRQVAESLRWARDALQLARKGVIPRSPDALVVAARHVPIILMSRDPLVVRMSERCLAPLQRFPEEKRLRLAETFLALIECGFNSSRASAHITVHPQTIRYRLRTLENLFGDDLYDPDLRLEFHLHLKYWLAAPGGPRA
ncbi:helix-turn-helix domain-containing protein [Actinocorallia longicatena]|uniref:PucR family transcriptional regulator n=1 Tax=Actinocorallia longicatena TaxID=111803 RepID=A0ABP6QKC8_9ACTN